ncbi:carboxynorspermidine decarboxylase [Methyloglobulus sp.]|uniref:carboxynorspermidine decarboxylase n=1 Tax=Methyloglobulus sp. TaxID=2518622 RepID=UPI0032B6FE99
MDIQVLKERILTSPTFVVDEDAVVKALKALATLRERSGCKVLYSIKALPLVAVLELAKPYLDGFSVSSLFEARLANEILAGQGSIHLTTPGIRPDEITELTSLCSHISCNSIGQFRQVTDIIKNQASIGIRINPKLSFADDARYDPCRQYSKLGADIGDTLCSEIAKQIKGLHFHTVFSAMDYAPLVQTLIKVRHLMGDKLAGLDWLNLGGGYRFDQIVDNSSFIDLITQLKNEFALDVYIEPGNAIVGKAGYLLATVIDTFNSDGKTVAVLDTSVNHHPQVFEYQRKPELSEHDPEGPIPVILAGNTCLAGDIFGEYRFNQPLLVGDRIVFKEVGAYSLVKANRFNGYNLPDVYLANNGQIRLIKHHTYEDYREQWMSDN